MYSYKIMGGKFVTNKIVYQRDLLYPIENETELGTMHLDVLGVGKNGKIQVVVENKSKHNPLKYIDSIISTMQRDVFDRLDVKVTEGIDLYFLADEEMKEQYGDKTYIKVLLKDANPAFEAVDEINI